MKNCIIAQSGGPTTVINASVIGIYEKNIAEKYFDKVYFGINGIEGVLNKNIIDTDTLSREEILNLKNTPSSGLGSCRYKLEDFKVNSYDYDNAIKILNEYKIDTFFYIGGNDSMDTIMKFNEYCKNTKCKIKFIGIPKTIDNDLVETDNCPGFGSAAKFISTVATETYLDASVYRNNGIFILETMGRDTGWLAASASIARINGEKFIDFIYVPEVTFNKEMFLKDVADVYKKEKKVYIVVAEGIKNAEGKFIAEQEADIHDNFGHSQLGGAGQVLKQLIIQNGITKRVKVLELGVLQRCAMHCAAKIDIEQAYKVGEYGITLARKELSGVMPIIKRYQDEIYKYKVEYIDIKKIANKTKYFPSEWINKRKNNINEEAYKYIYPLTLGIPTANLNDELDFALIYK